MNIHECVTLLQPVYKKFPKYHKIKNFLLLQPKLADGGMWLVVIYMHLQTTV